MLTTDEERAKMKADAEWIEALRNRTTHEPWTARFTQQDAIIEDADRADGEVARMQLPLGAECVDVMDNFNFIAASRTDPSSANVLRLLEEVELLKEKLQEWIDHPSGWAGFRSKKRFIYSTRGVDARFVAQKIIDACHVHGVPVPEHLKAYEKGGET